MQDLLERRSIVTRGLGGLFGHLLETHDFVRTAARQPGDLPHAGDPAPADPGVHQPVPDAGGR